jgi:peptide/nickel transport system substrate-binding protein
VPISTPTATPLPPKELTVCQGEEPNTLFVYGGPSPAARNVLDAIYDGPIDARNYLFEPVILERIPSLEHGDAALRTVYVGEGERVLSADGEVVELLPEVAVRDADGEEVFFHGEVVSMTQMVVTFTLRADVTWADGEPLTAEDSWFSYELAGQLDDAALQRRLDRMASYQVEDSRSIVWTGVPGYRDSYYLLNFYHPLPQHVLGGTSVEQLLETDVAQRRPLGWGPFVVEAWEEGDHITLVRNPHYFRASEGLPHLDRVTFRFLDNPRQAIEGLLAGECDIVSEDLLGGGAASALLVPPRYEGVDLISAPSSEWEHLDFGIQPARWSGRTAFFDDRGVRQAVAHCVDRERIAAEAFPYLDASVAHSYVLPQHPLHAGEALRRWEYDPSAGRSMLEEAGWQDANEDGILEAQAVPGVARGTVFSVTLLTTRGDAVRRRAAGILEENLADCGIDLGVEYLAPDVFYADGPDGPVFGRQFDLALFSWLNGLDAPCALYVSAQIPTEENWWATSNNPGYASEAYDEACRSAQEALYGTSSFARFHGRAQRIFSQDLPVLPLYFVPKLVAVGPGVTGVVLDPSQQTVFWNVETFDVRR